MAVSNFNGVSTMKIRSVRGGILCLAVLSNCASYRDVPLDRWIGMEFIVDGRVDIQLMTPPEKGEKEEFKPHFINSSTESFERLFIANYDPGWGQNRGLYLTTFASSIKRVEPRLGQDSGPSLEYIKNNVYLARDDAAKEFDIVGEVVFNDQPWLRVNLIGGHRKGILYATIVNEEYMLLVAMNIYGKDSDQTRLYSTRHETLKKIVNSVKFSTE